MIAALIQTHSENMQHARLPTQLFGGSALVALHVVGEHFFGVVLPLFGLLTLKLSAGKATNQVPDSSILDDCDKLSVRSLFYSRRF